METVKRYQKLMFMGVPEYEFIQAYKNIFRLKCGEAGKIEDIERMWREDNRPTFNEFVVKGDNFIHESYLTKILYNRRKMNVLFDFKNYPDINFASLCIVEFYKITNAVLAEYEPQTRRLKYDCYLGS